MFRKGVNRPSDSYIRISLSRLVYTYDVSSKIIRNTSSS